MFLIKGTARKTDRTKQTAWKTVRSNSSGNVAHGSSFVGERGMVATSKGGIVENVYDYFEDDEDRQAFQELDKKIYTAVILPLKHRRINNFSFDFSMIGNHRDGSREWSGKALKRLGVLLAKSAHLKEVSLKVDDEDPCPYIRNEDISLLFSHPIQQQLSIEKFCIVSEEDWSLKPNATRPFGDYLRHAPMLKELTIQCYKCDMKSTRILSSSLSNATLQKLDLSFCSFEEGALAALLTLVDESKLEHLKLAGCQLDSETFRAIRRILCVESPVIESLDLTSYREFDEEDFKGLCLSLGVNTSLTTIKLGGEAYEAGLEHLDKLLFDTSRGIHSVFSSNHTVQNIKPFIYVDEFSEDQNQQLSSVKASLRINRSSINDHNETAVDSLSNNVKLRRHRKIVKYLTLGGALNTMPFDNIASPLMPHVIGLLGRKTNYPKCCKWNDRRVNPLDCLHQLFRRFPTLCSYPSPEKVRFTSRIKELLMEIRELRSDNVMHLRGGNDVGRCENHFKKRPRFS